jgi:hypothetical protein
MFIVTERACKDVILQTTFHKHEYCMLYSCSSRACKRLQKSHLSNQGKAMQLEHVQSGSERLKSWYGVIPCILLVKPDISWWSWCIQIALAALSTVGGAMMLPVATPSSWQASNRRRYSKAFLHISSYLCMCEKHDSYPQFLHVPLWISPVSHCGHELNTSSAGPRRSWLVRGYLNPRLWDGHQKSVPMGWCTNGLWLLPSCPP